MQQERRLHPRLKPTEAIEAHITIDRSPEAMIEIDGKVIDISYTGVKIRLPTPLPKISVGRLKIVMILPESKIPLIIHGEIKHIDQDLYYGLQYAEDSTEDMLDPMMFECVKYCPEHNNTNNNATGD